MALFKSQLVTQASGSVGGTTYSHNSSGLYMRARSIPTNPSSALQRNIRGSFSSLSQRWNTVVTPAQRDGWATYAAAVGVRNKLGDTIYLTGRAMYIRCNTVRTLPGTPSYLDDAPTTLTIGDPLVGALSQASMTPFGISLAWSNDLTENDLIYLFTSLPQNQTINFFKAPFAYYGVTVGDVSPSDLILPSSAGWIAGVKLFLKANISYADGRYSPPTIMSLVLAATPV